MFNFVCMFVSLSAWVPVCLIMCVFVYVGGWVDVCICELVEQAEPQPGSVLGRILTQTVCSNETSARGGIVWEDPRVCECVKSANSGQILTRLTWKEEQEEEKARVDKILQRPGNWGNMRVKEKEINEREGRQLPVCVSASPWSDWELQAPLSGLSLHTRRCHISLTGQQASLLLRPSLTSMWIITQCWERQRKTRRCSRAFKKENPPSLNSACCDGGNKQYIFNGVLLEHLMLKNERNRRVSQEYHHELKFFSK